MNERLEFSDRYTALGIPYPNPATMCKGQCEGTGWMPIYMTEGDHRPVEAMSIVTAPETDREFVAAWREAEAAHATDDGWHFVKCPRCRGTGKRR